MSSRASQTIPASAAANYSRRTEGVISRDPGAGNYQATTISFTATATIADSANGLGIYIVNDTIEVRGSAANSRQYVVLTTSAGALTVNPPVITTEAATPLITIQRQS